jgi:flavorubredoxin
LFDELIPLPGGTSYNAYLVKGSDKTALIDTVDPSKKEELFDHLIALQVKHIDYIITNHAEQDHSGTIPHVLEAFPMARVVTHQKAKEFVKDLLMVPEEKFVTIKDRETLPLGNRTLEFILAPWVHWPETMLTFLREDKILFPCDLFGSHLATSDTFAVDEARCYEAAKRYYAEIMMPFREKIKGYIQKVKELGVEMIAPSHGPVYHKPRFILNAYEDWVGDGVKNEVVIPYVSMHGSTEKMVNYFLESLMIRNVAVKPFNLSKTDVGELAMSLVDAATLVVATPTVLVGPHPLVMYAAYLANLLRPKTRFVSIICSYGWAGKVVEQLAATIPNLKAEIIEPVIVKGYPKENNWQLLDQLADKIVARHKDIGAK